MTDATNNEPVTRTGSGHGASLINNPKFRAVIYQAAMLLGVVLLIWWLQSNAAYNLGQQNKSIGFGFLNSTSGFQIGFSLLPYERASTYFDVYLVGIVNTLLVASIGIVLATMLGFTIGIARLSPNWILRKLAMVYVEVMRNIPLLLQLFFWYFLLLNALPAVRDSYALGDLVFLNQRGLYLPAIVSDGRFLIVVAGFLIALGAAIWFRRRTIKKIEETGDRKPIWLPMIAIFAVIFAIAYFGSGAPVELDFPELRGFNYAGGFQVPPELTALILGLVIYTSAFIAEVVRAGIQSVSYGQVEAAEALGLRESDRMRLVVIPQAMRVIVPPLTSQYLNLTKNSSLGAAIGFPELVSVFAGTALNQSGRAIEIIALTMAVYLTFSLLTSIFMNWYNARVALVER
ncbi:amino acid ABC transporter permease [Pelagibacterium lacus]|uniref:ABC transporter permease subunit n=1 Tax=Pelagibacterium lacus TaxID=2282655 RepID=A0A369W298_9HYPH|nr:amino acid ABC transporter permease [Pelagibacterium lacus]RDE08493.1 ABC transporter permease subunit [Pelagibacterium lacus]